MGPNKDKLLWSLADAIDNAFDSGNYADLTIECRGKAFKVHKLIVCTQSEFFAAAVKDGHFKEGHTNVIELPEDEPAIVAAALNFLYRFDYTHEVSRPETPASRDTSPEPNASSMAFHLTVYALADKLRIVPLKGLAETKFEAVAKGSWFEDEFPPAIAQAYSVAPPGKYGDKLRKIVVSVATDHCRRLFDDEFRQTLETTPEFAADLVQTMAGGAVALTPVAAVSLRKFTCRTCAFEFYADGEALNDQYTCPACTCEEA